jgi:ubiquinone/menaquinone biosynthesis C-methylase UbiE
MKPTLQTQFLNEKLLSARVYPEFFPCNLNDIIINIGCGFGPQAIIYKDCFQKMVGVDINKERLEQSLVFTKICGVKSYSTVCANVEKIPLKDRQFTKALAIDIIEHVEHPQRLLNEAYRLLQPEGRLLITFPASHDRFVDLVSQITQVFRKEKMKAEKIPAWNPDEHNQEKSVQEWIKLVELAGFTMEKTKATTLFPPLHLYGVPKFWFKNNLIHALDSYLSSIEMLKPLGQGVMAVFRKI